MTSEKQRIAIAEHLGFKHGTFITETHWFDDCVSDGQEEVLFADHVTDGAQVRVPRFIDDLNAMHEAEKLLRPGGTYGEWARWDSYVQTLGDGFTGRDDVAHATAAQRAEAFLRAVGKWEDGE